MKEKRKKIVHLINDIAMGGGAQKMLYNITKYADLNKFDISVISLLPLEGYKEEMTKNNIKVYIFDIKKHPLKAISGIISILKEMDTLFCWMYASNFVGYFCGKFAKVKKINFGIRQSNIDKNVMKITTRVINKICSYLSYSKYVTNVIYNGEKAKSVHEKMGYDKGKTKVIQNGCETTKFKYNSNARDDLLRSNNKIKKNTKLIISATRYNKIKDVPNFLTAMGIVKKIYSDIQIFMCGNGFVESNEELLTLINKNNLKVNEDIFLMGLIDNLYDMFSACDLYVLHSAGEAFPNTLLEAMACEIECVVTNAGDTEKIFPKKDHIVKIGDSEQLAEKICEILRGKTRRHPEYRRVIEENYSIEKVVKEYECYY